MKATQIFLVVIIGVVAVSCSDSTGQNNGRKRLIKTSENDPGQWMTEEEIFGLLQTKVGFMDITDFDYSNVDIRNVDVHAIPTEIKFNTTVRSVINNLDSDRVYSFIEHFSSYYDRFYASETGRSSQLWLLSEVQSSLEGYAGNATVFEVGHAGYEQKSIVAKLIGSDPTLRDEVIVLGAHLDSAHRWGTIFPAPGADDNGSGTVTILETLRDIVQSGLFLKRTVEFHWYAAEEVGLLGSQDIALDYLDKNVNVVAMMNLDVVAYYNGTDDIGIYTDNGNAEVQQFFRILADEYLTFGRRDVTCGYACSDHASWTTAGYPAAQAAEIKFHPFMHYQQDDIESISFTQLNEFIKLAIGFTIEIAEPII